MWIKPWICPSLSFPLLKDHVAHHRWLVFFQFGDSGKSDIPDLKKLTFLLKAEHIQVWRREHVKIHGRWRSVCAWPVLSRAWLNEILIWREMISTKLPVSLEASKRFYFPILIQSLIPFKFSCDLPLSGWVWCHSWLYRCNPLLLIRASTPVKWENRKGGRTFNITVATHAV